MRDIRDSGHFIEVRTLLDYFGFLFFVSLASDSSSLPTCGQLTLHTSLIFWY